MREERREEALKTGSSLPTYFVLITSAVSSLQKEDYESVKVFLASAAPEGSSSMDDHISEHGEEEEHRLSSFVRVDYSTFHVKQQHQSPSRKVG